MILLFKAERGECPNAKFGAFIARDKYGLIFFKEERIRKREKCLAYTLCIRA
jgi:hypothetical protein